MKRGNTVKLISLSFILLLSISLVSASFLGNLFEFIITGKVTGGTTDCYDGDGPDNFDEKSSVTIGIDVYNDYCFGDIAYDYYCYCTDLDSTGTADVGGATYSFLNLFKSFSITGKATDDGPDPVNPDEPTGESCSAAKTSIDCMAELGLPCYAGRCGCTIGETMPCGPEESGIGICTSGNQTCQADKTWGTCTGAVYPGIETCNGLDDDCDGSTDEGTLCSAGYACIQGRCILGNPGCNDGDNDGYGVSGSISCQYSGTDCDDTNPNVNPGATETCNNDGVDNDCDGVADEDDPDADKWCENTYASDMEDPICDKIYGSIAATCLPSGIRYQPCPDNDNDGYYVIVANCQLQDNQIAGDCDDTNPNVNPGATEICNGIDDNCIWGVDDGVLKTYYQDYDQDGYGNINIKSYACTKPSGYSSLNTDCNDNNENINPEKTEICDDGIDNNCDDKTDCDDTATCSCSKAQNCCDCIPDCSNKECGLDGCGGECGTCDTGYFCNEDYTCTQSCIDKDGDGYGIGGSTTCEYSGTDCDDTNPNINPKEKEICDGIDNNCNEEIDENLFQLCGTTSVGICTQAQILCENGAWKYDSCDNHPDFITANTEEICNNELDDDCDGSVDEGCGCTSGQTKSCEPEELCKIGEQTCVNSEWSTCEVTGDKPNCDIGNACSPETAETCGTNAGICLIGMKTCKSDGTWGECVGAIEPEEEMCEDGKDNDCDGIADEQECKKIKEELQDLNLRPQDMIEQESPTYSLDSSIQTGSSSSGGTNSVGTQKGFFSKVAGFLKTIFNLVRSMVGFSISEAPLKTLCSDSDAGKNYFLMGSGQGLTQNDAEIWFEDFCYEEMQSNKVDKCAGDNCYLKEYFCDMEYIKSETEITCQYGCVNGACVPDSSLNDNCLYFDKEQWKWINKC